MMGGTIPAVALPTYVGVAPAPERGLRVTRGPLPLADLPPGRTRSSVYGFATVDDRGRIADGRIYRALGWLAGTRLQVRQCTGLVVVCGDPQGIFQVSKKGLLQVPALVRGCTGISPGDRVFLVAEPDRDALVVYPTSALDTMITSRHEAVFVGDTP